MYRKILSGVDRCGQWHTYYYVSFCKYLSCEVGKLCYMLRTPHHT